MAKVGVIAVDGTKVQANASRNENLDYEQLAREIVQEALATDAAYIGVVASRKRAASVVEMLRAQGVSDEALARVHVPAGLDLGHVEHEEIAVSVLAELVKLKGEGLLVAGTPAVVAEREEAIDPVCNMTVDVATARFKSEHEGQTYYFCCPACKKKFDADPASLLVAS